MRMIVIGLIDDSEVKMIEEIIKISATGMRIRELYTTEIMKAGIESKIFEELIMKDLKEEFSDVCNKKM